MEKKIPTEKEMVEIAGASIEIEMYSWLTQDEENAYTMLIVDPKNYQDGDDGERVQVLTADTIVEAKKFLVENMLKSHTWDEFNVLHPEIRASIVEKLIAKRTESGKKK